MAEFCGFLFIAFTLLVIVRTICLFDNFEKLSVLLGFSSDIMEGWARVCCAHVFLVGYLMAYTAKSLSIRVPDIWYQKPTITRWRCWILWVRSLSVITIFTFTGRVAIGGDGVRRTWSALHVWKSWFQMVGRTN